MQIYYLMLKTFLLWLLLHNHAMSSDYWSRAYGVGSGSQIELNTQLVFEAGSHQVFFQNQKVKVDKPHSYSLSVDQYYPFCYFELRAPLDDVLIVQPQKFDITQLRVEESQFVALAPVRIASLSGGYDGVDIVAEFLFFDLHSNLQPQIEFLACSDGFDFDGQTALINLKQVEDVLGSVVLLKLAN